MAHTLNTSVESAGPTGPRWRSKLPQALRSFGRSLLYAWPSVSARVEIRQKQKIASEERQAILDRSVPIIQDAYGYRFAVYPYDRPNLLNLACHPADVAELKAIPRLIRSGDIAIDVGAHIGLYSILFSRLCGPRGHVWAFEPAPETYWRLRETLVLNRCENVVPVQAAVCDEDGTATMSLFDPSCAEWNTLARPEIDPSGRKVQSLPSVQVSSLTLDRFCERENISHINFLKVDVEGYESSVLAGAAELLRNHRVDFLCFEISQRPLVNAGFRSHDVFAALERHGYFSYALDKESGAFSGPVHDTQENWANFFASPNDLRKL